MLAVMLLLGSPRAGAADVDLFSPAASLSRLHGTLQGEAPTVRRGGLSMGAIGALVADPVVRGQTSVVGRLVPVHLQASYDVGDRFRIDASMPLYVDTDVPFSEFSGHAPGDVRLGALWSVAGEDGGPIALGVLPGLTLATGSTDALVSSGWSGGATAALGGRFGPVGWILNGGVVLGEQAPLDAEADGLGLRANVVGGTFVHLGRPVRVGAEVDAQFGGVSNNLLDESRSVSVQGFVQVASGQGLGLLLGGGSGLVQDVGTARYRLFAALSWTAWRSDRDDDTIADRLDRCPEEAEDTDGFEDGDGCPELDNDGDALVDAEDACPDEPEDVDDWLDDDGCPEPDNDEDGLLDGQDECPTEAGRDVHAGCPDRDDDGLRDLDDTCPDGAGPEEDAGCPDSDGDGFHDGLDGCPERTLPDDELRWTSDGCPRPVYVTATAIRVPGIAFSEGGSEISRASTGTLDALAARLALHPTLGRVEIQGHTDNVGPSSYNRRLSQRRANSVRAYLIQKGVPPERLVARGYGESRPRFTNRTEGGRMRNRRVQFVLLDPPMDPTDASTSP